MCAGLIGAVDTFGIIEIAPELRGNIHQFGSVIEILGTAVAVGVGIALLYETANNHRPFRAAAVVGLTVPVVFPWLLQYLYQFSLATDFQAISVLRIAVLLAGLAGL